SGVRPVRRPPIEPACGRRWVSWPGPDSWRGSSCGPGGSGGGAGRGGGGGSGCVGGEIGKGAGEAVPAPAEGHGPEALLSGGSWIATATVDDVAVYASAGDHQPPQRVPGPDHTH